MEALRMYRDGVNNFLGTSTFGRVFRLEGCGHVWTISLRQRHELIIDAGERDHQLEVHHGDPSWSDNFLHYGLRHIRQCMYSLLQQDDKHG